MIDKKVFQNSDFDLKAQILSLVTNTTHCFPWSDRLTLFIVKKLSARDPGLNNQFVCHTFVFQVKVMFSRKNVEKMFTQGSRLNIIIKLVTFPTSSRASLSEPAFCFLNYEHCLGNAMTAGTVWWPCLGSRECVHVFTHHCWCAISANVSMVKNVKMSQYCYEGSFNLTGPFKGPQGPPTIGWRPWRLFAQRDALTTQACGILMGKGPWRWAHHRKSSKQAEKENAKSKHPLAP